MANIVITGANRGIGLELARAYSDGGDRVFACVRDPGSAAALKDLAKSSGGKVTVLKMDVGDPKSVDAAVREIGDVPVDVIINNAGVFGGKDQSFDGVDFDEWVSAFNVMTFGPLRVTRALMKNLTAAKNPKVMTVTSQLAASTWPMGGMYAYASAKAAVNKVMQVMAIDLKDKNVVVSMIHPGWVKTDMGGPNADITPQESAKGIKNVISRLTAAESGKFYKWNGDIHPW